MVAVSFMVQSSTLRPSARASRRVSGIRWPCNIAKRLSGSWNQKSRLHDQWRLARDLPFSSAERQTDLQLSYAFDTGVFKGLSTLLQVNNLTNSPYATRQGNGFGDVVAPEEYNRYGRQTLLGLSYKL